MERENETKYQSGTPSGCINREKRREGGAPANLGDDGMRGSG